ncbi:MAG: hypothetical protein K0B52_05410 [FCB group bacterium]|nr:hypothetical protein [FCB group bacterium]
MAILCFAVIVFPLQAQPVVFGYQYDLDKEYFSGYMMVAGLLGPLGVYGNFYGVGVTRSPDYASPWPGDELVYTYERSYWVAPGIGLNFSLFPRVLLYAG